MGLRVARLSADDLTNLATDRGSVPMQIGALLLLDEDSAPRAAELVPVIARRLARIPRLRERLYRPRLGGGAPYWGPVPDVQEAAIRVTAAPATEAGLLDALVSEVLRRLPLDHPLWRAVVYADRDGAAVGVAMVMHHVLADGIGGLAVLAELVDGGADDDRPATAGRRALPSRRDLVRDAWVRRRRAVHRLPASWRALGAGLRELGGAPRQRAARTSLLRPTSARRRLEIVQVDLAPVVAAAHAQEATVNDLLLVAVSGALRRVLEQRRERLHELVVSVPVSGRPVASTEELGNQVGVRPVTVPLVEDPLVRLAAIRRQRVRTAPRASSGAVLSLLFRGLAAVGVFPWFVNRQRLVHTFLTNLRGPPEPLELGGSRIRRIVPLALVPGNVTVSFDVLSYAGRVLVSVVHDPEHVPDHDLLRAALEEELVALGDLS